MREIEEKDREHIFNALERSWKVAKRKKTWVDQYKYEDGEYIVDCIYNNIDSVIVDETYLVCYQINDVWYSKKRVLNECLVMKIHKNKSDFGYVVQALEQIAKDHQCDGILVGTAFSANDTLLARKYEGYGFRVEEMNLYKGV